MPITEKELLAGFLSKTVNMDASGVAALYNADGTELNSDALEVILKLDSERVAKIKPDTKKFFDDGYKKAQAEVATKVEKAIAEAVGLETDLKGDEFKEALVTFVGEKASKGKEITDDAVKLHPVFKAREKELLKLNKETSEKAIADVEKVTKEVARKEVLAKINAKALSVIEDKAMLPADKEKAKKQIKRLVLDSLEGYDYEIGENGEVTVITKDGKRLEDEHGNAKKFDELVLSTATENGIEFKVAGEKDSANPKGKPEGGPAKPIVLPTTEDEYKKVLADENIPSTEKTAIIKAWNTKT